VKLKSGFNFVDLSSVNQQIGQAAATAINNDGLVVGGYTVGGVFSSFVWDTKAGGDPIVGIGYNDPAARKLLSNGAYLGTRLLDVNHERIVGRIDFKGTPMISFAFWISLAAAQNGAVANDFNVLKPHPADLPTSLDNFFHAHGVNDKNQIVGIYKDTAFAAANGNPGGTVGFLFTPDGSGPWGGTFQTIAPAPGGQFTQLFGINNEGELIGDSGAFKNDGTMEPFAYVWPAQNGNATQPPEQLPVVLPLGGAPFAIGHKISNNHQVVGEANRTAGETGGPANGWQTAFKPAKPPQDIVANFQATKNGAAYGHTTALGVNDPGWIVGSATLNPDPANPATGSEAFVYVP
jgi:hypothetical protein